MSIRRQSIISAIVIYIGFAIGLLNTYFFTRQGNSNNFTGAEYGLTQIFIAIATMMATISSLAMPAFIFKFFPYYKDHLPENKNEMISWALVISLIGFILVIIAGLLLKDLVIKKYGTNTPQLITYYYWIFPLGLGLTIFNVLEAYGWSLHKSVVTNYFKEVQWRLFTTLLLVLFLTNTISDFDLFIKLFAFTYPGIAIGLLIYLLATGKIHFTLAISKVTRRMANKILALCTFIYGGSLIFTISQVFDTLVIASILGPEQAAIFGLAQIMTSIVQAPQRGIVSASLAHLSRAWKEKNMALLQRIYQRSSINQLIVALGLFLLIYMNFEDGFTTFAIQHIYFDAKPIFFILGITRIIDMGTGVNSQIIATSVHWKFELISGIILIAIMLPLTYILTKEYGVTGPAIGSLVSISIYNIIRTIFLWKKFNLFPLTIQSLYTVLLAAACFAVCYFAFDTIHGIPGMLIRSIVFILLYAAGCIYMKLSPDIQSVMLTVRKRLKLKTN